MYVPHFNVMADTEIDDFVDGVGAAELVTVGDDGYPLVTLLPVVRDGVRLILHMARANPHWKAIAPDTKALAIVTGPQAYVSPSWYASKAEHGKVVPTWNYSSVHLTGRVTVRDDPDWLLEAVRRLTDLHEQRREKPRSVHDAPEPYIHKQLKAIVGIEMTVEKVEAKAKLSQNRSDQDAAGVVAGLRHEGGPREHQVADAMSRLR